MPLLTCVNCFSTTDLPLIVCSNCGTWRSFTHLAKKPSAGYVPDQAVATAKELSQKRSTFLSNSKEVKDFMGEVPAGQWGLCLYGEPGSFKSTTALILANQLCQSLGPVLYNSLEEGHGSSISLRLQRLEIRRDDLYIACLTNLNTIIETAKELRCKVVVFDSWNYMQNVSDEDILRIQREVNCSTITVLHATKAGLARGSLSVLHASDVVIQLKDGGFKIEKSRFSPLKEGVLEWSQNS